MLRSDKMVAAQPIKWINGGFAADKIDEMKKMGKIDKMGKALLSGGAAASSREAHLSLRSSYFISRVAAFIARSAFISRVAACCLLLSACDTRRDILDDQGVWVHIEADWRQAGIRPEGASIYAFNCETGAQVTQLLTNEMRADSVTCDSLKLHAGNYSLLVFNETERSHDYLSFRGTGRYHSAEAYASPITLPANGRFSKSAAAQPNGVHTMVASSDVLAAARLDRFELGYDIIRRQERPQLRFIPERLSVTVEVILHLQNMHSLYPGKQQAGALDNMAEGVFLATGRPNDTPATFWFALTPVAFDPDTKSGTLRAVFAGFGPLDTQTNNISLYFLLRDDTEFTAVRDVTAQLHAAEIMPERRLVVEIGLGLTPGDDPIVLPDISTDGMFEVDVDDWDDAEDIDIPI